jgi:demethylmacrocin O-methyltransferase
MSVLRSAYPVYRPILSRLGLLDTIGRKHWSDKRLHGYLKHYRRHFHPWRNKRIKLLEIGIGGHDRKEGGHSLRMWKDYFPKGEIYGLDLYDKSYLQEPRITILQADQNDADALSQIASRHGPFDIIIDDGSHISEHIITSFRTLFPHVKPDGLYVIEDLYLSYEEKDHGGSTVEFNDPRTANGFLKTLIEEMHHMYIPGYVCRNFGERITEFCFYPKICFIQKGDNHRDPYFQGDYPTAGHAESVGAARA